MSPIRARSVPRPQAALLPALAGLALLLPAFAPVAVAQSGAGGVPQAAAQAAPRGAAGSGPASAPAPAASASDSSEPAPVARGLAAIRAEDVAADVAFLACDDMGGRDTPSVGQRLAARFLRQRLQRLGWQPGAKDGWFHAFPLVERRLDVAACSAAVTRDGRRLDLVLGRDYAFSPRALAALDVDAEVVCFPSVGNGELPAAGDSLRGRWVLVPDPRGQSAHLDEELRTAGAAGLLTGMLEINGAAPDGGPGVVFDIWLPIMQQPDVRPPEPRPFLPRLYLPRATLDALLELAGAPEPANGQVLPVRLAEARRLTEERTIEAENVAAFWPGSDARLDQELLVVCAHYDHPGPDAKGRIFNGADDNASGCAALLALAEALAAHGPLACPVLLVWFAGEEPGLWGSQAFVRDAWYPQGAQPAAVINLDMVGRGPAEQLLLSPSAEHAARNDLAALAESLAWQEGFTDVRSGDGYFERSDHTSFAPLSIPLLFVSSEMHDDYHQPTDDAEKIDADRVRRAARLLFRVLVDVQHHPRAR